VDDGPLAGGCLEVRLLAGREVVEDRHGVAVVLKGVHEV
jgi:hypothetical protein